MYMHIHTEQGTRGYSNTTIYRGDEVIAVDGKPTECMS